MHALSLVQAPSTTVADALVTWLVDAGVRRAFGVSGGGVAALWAAMSRSDALSMVHTQHEGGAVFAATEASLATGELVVVMVTTGPGLTNALTGLVAARQEGARVLLISSLTPTGRRGRGATQETGPEGPLAALYAAGAVMHVAAPVESAAQLRAMLHKVAWGLADPGGFVAHLGLPSDVAQGQHGPIPYAPVRRPTPAVAPAILAELATTLERGEALILVGREAGEARHGLLELVERVGAPVVSAPQGKGVLPEDHPCHLGVVGFAGGEHVAAALAARPFQTLLVLGAALGEAETGYMAELRPDRQIVLVGPRAEPPHGAYADVAHTVVTAPVSTLVEGRLARARPGPTLVPPTPPPAPRRSGRARAHGPVRPAALMEAVQRTIVEGSDAILLAECGNTFAWAIHHLRLPEPRLRVSVGWGSMGHVSMGAIGVAAAGRRAVALVGDGAMLMGHEIVTAARHRLDVVWIVLNDAGYGMCRHGMAAMGLSASELDQPEVDFAALARSLGVRGATIRDERDLEPRLAEALSWPGPTVIDVRIDPDERPPIGARVSGLTFHAQPRA